MNHDSWLRVTLSRFAHYLSAGDLSAGGHASAASAFLTVVTGKVIAHPVKKAKMKLLCANSSTLPICGPGEPHIQPFHLRPTFAVL
jgi:hypothetical protein